MELSSNGFNFLKSVEGKHNKPYWDNGMYSVGYGHRGKDVNPKKIYSDSEIEAFFKQDKIRIEKEVNKIFKAGMTQNMYDALFSFTYNVGHLEGTELAKMIQNDYKDPAIKEFWKYTWTNKKQNKGLVNRRIKEVNLYFS